MLGQSDEHQNWCRHGHPCGRRQDIHYVHVLEVPVYLPLLCVIRLPLCLVSSFVAWRRCRHSLVNSSSSMSAADGAGGEGCIGVGVGWLL